ncbi:zinc finger and BTB domain-containing protein 41-like [Condylostylus longicornis]|uniref:zinc finger and BTB domain-containing protein 41-like n=1 Tax=Condylostylus longicornis TaxID=2530218 RepID=UPI00244E08EA|nr:zinc finger and BTB domain-containing protein 41-like [Condylostylus longicornis]
MTTWDNEDFENFIEFLKEREYLYNRNHHDYKIYTVVKECSQFGSSLNPPRTSKEVLDKITAIRKDVRIIKQIVADQSSEYNITDTEKFKETALTLKFMYSALFGKNPKAIANLDSFLGKTLKRKSTKEDESKSKKQRKYQTIDEDRETNTYECIEILKDGEEYLEEITDSNQKNYLIENQVYHDAKKSFTISDTDTDLMIDSISTIEESAEQNHESLDLGHIEITIDQGIDVFHADKIENEDVFLRIIDFIQSKPYYYKKDSDLYENIELKEKELYDFGRTFEPPMSSKKLMVMIEDIVKKFHNSIEKPDSEKWNLFNQCKFLLSDTRNNVDNIKNDIKYIPKKNTEAKRTIKEDVKLLFDVVTFIEDNTCFYDEHDEDFYNFSKKADMIDRFKSALQCKYSERDIEKKLEYVQERINKQKNNKFGENFVFVQDSFEKLQNVEETNMQRKDSLPLINEDNRDPKKKTATHCVASVQCNLYEEHLEQKIRELAATNRNCNCIGDLLHSLFQNEEKNVSDAVFSDTFQEACKTELDNSIKEEIDEDNQIGNFLIEVDFPDFSDISSDDGLVEIPFEEFIPQIKPNKLPNGKYSCEECNATFDDYAHLKAHDQIHGEKSLVCYKCGKVNKYYRKLRLHENNCNPEGNKNCYECNVIFKNHLNYYDHQNQYHTKSNPYICVCRQAFTSYNKIITHLNRSDCGAIDDCVLPEYVTKHFVKGFLEQKYEDEDEFVKTMEKTKFWCKICKRNYVRNDVYTKHFTRQFHLNAEREWLKNFNIEKIFACDYCNNGDEPTTFKNLHQLVVHRHAAHHKCTLKDFFEEMENIASSEKPLELPFEISLVSLVCRICDSKYDMNLYAKHFRSKEHQKHERSWLINHNIKLFACDICSEEFDRLIAYLEHKHEFHLEWPTNKLLKEIEGIDIELIGKKYYKYYCSICDYKTNNRRFYANHILIHGSHYKCACGKTYKTHEKFTSHRLYTKCSNNGCIRFSSKNVFKYLN